MPVPYLSYAAKVSAAVCVLYGSTSLILSLVNKALFATYNFNAIFTLLSAQMLISVAVCTISRDYWGNPLNVPDFSWGLLRKALPIGFRESQLYRYLHCRTRDLLICVFLVQYMSAMSALA